MRKVCIAGMGIVPFRRYEDEDWYDFGSQALLNCLKDAEMEFRDIQVAFCGSVYQGTGSGQRTLSEIGMTGIPIMNLEQACSSSSVTFRLAYLAIATELYDIALAMGFEKSPRGLLPSTAFAPWEMVSGFGIQPANYALKARRYIEDYGATDEDFARVTVMERKHANINPNAFFYQRGEPTIEEVLNSRMIASPITLLMAAPMPDGAVAFILCPEGKLKSGISKEKKIQVVAAIHETGHYGEQSLKFQPSIEEGMIRESVKKAWDMSGLSWDDVDLILPYDTMSPGFLWDVDEMGFCKPGECPRLLREGYFEIGGKLPANTDGGLMGCGHPLGATGGRQIYELALQLREAAGARQVEGARIGLSHAMGAGPNSTITVLKRV